MNNDTTNIVPGTPTEPVTPEAISTPVETAIQEQPSISFDSPVEAPKEEPVKSEEIKEEVPVEPVVEAPVVEAASAVEETPVEQAAPIEAPTPVVEQPVDETPVEPVASIAEELYPVFFFLLTQKITIINVETKNPANTIPIIAPIVIPEVFTSIST